MSLNAGHAASVMKVSRIVGTGAKGKTIGGKQSYKQKDMIKKIPAKHIFGNPLKLWFLLKSFFVTLLDPENSEQLREEWHQVKTRDRGSKRSSPKESLAVGKR